MVEETDNINIGGKTNRVKVCGVVLFVSKLELLIGRFINANKPVSMQLGRFRTS
jgi:hypothetical protein